NPTRHLRPAQSKSQTRSCFQRERMGGNQSIETAHRTYQPCSRIRVHQPRLAKPHALARLHAGHRRFVEATSTTSPHDAKDKLPGPPVMMLKFAKPGWRPRSASAVG